MRFVDFLRITVLLSAGAASALAALTVLRATQSDDPLEVLVVAAIWWPAAGAYGLWQGRGGADRPAAEPIARLLVDARHSPQLPEPDPVGTVLNRLWPLLLVTLLAGGLALVLPQVGTVAAGFAIIWALALRAQDGAVAAVEERDACRFYVDRTKPVEPIRLIRTPGFGGAFYQQA